MPSKIETVKVSQPKPPDPPYLALRLCLKERKQLHLPSQHCFLLLYIYKCVVSRRLGERFLKDERRNGRKRIWRRLYAQLLRTKITHKLFFFLSSKLKIVLKFKHIKVKPLLSVLEVKWNQFELPFFFLIQRENCAHFSLYSSHPDPERTFTSRVQTQRANT